MENNKGKRKQNKETRAHGRKACKNKLKLIRATLMLCFAVIISACFFSLPAIEAIAATPGSGTVEETHTTQGVTWTKNGNTWTCTINVDDDSLSWYAYESSVPSGYSTISTSSDARTVTNNAVTIANSGAKHTLTLNPNGGTVENSPTSINKDFYTYKKTMNTAPIPTRANCTFDGWYDSNTKVFNANGTANTAATAYWKVSGSNTVWNKNANVTVTAKWIPHYNMTYDIGSGSWPSGAVHPSSTKQGIVFEVTKPTPPTGYNFAYWQITGMDGNTHYWDATDGSKAQGTATSGNAVVDASASTPVPATKFKNLSGTPGATVAFKAVYGEKTGVIKYNNNGHGTVPNPQNISYSQAYNVAAAPSNPTGYTFQRWNTKADNSGSAFAAGAKYKEANQVVNVLGDPIGFNGNDNLYAIWKIHKYNITYDYAGGTGGSNKPTSANWDEVKTIDNPTRTGYTFSGWSISGMDGNTHYWDTSAGTTSQGTGTTASAVKATKFKNLNAGDGSTVKFTATWTPNTYTISYNLDGGSYGTNHPTSGTYDTALTIDVPTKSGYAFIGWEISGMDSTTHYWDNGSGTTGRGTATTGNTDRTGATKFKNLRSTAGTVTLKARWGHYIDLNGTLDGSSSGNITNYGTVDMYINGSKVSTGISDFCQVWPEGTTWEVKNIQTASGKTYLSGSNLSGTLGSSNIDARLVFATNHTLTANANGGSIPSTSGWSGTGNTATKTVAYSVAYGTLPTPTRTGYTFNGWYTAASGGSAVSASTTMGTANTTIYAQWTINTYTITYDLAGGSHGSTHPANYNVTSDTFTISQPTKTGYTFTGWTVNTAPTWASGSTTSGKDIKVAKGSYGNIKLTATWSINKYNLTVNPNGGSWNGSTSAQTIGQNYNTTKDIPEPTRNGYTFVGWMETGAGRLGKVTNADPTFDTSNGGVSVYNNSGNGMVTHSIQSSSAGAAYGNREILITTANGTTSPGLGGFVQNTASAAGKKYIHTFVAKIPVGYSVQHAENATGNGRQITWLTPTAGTGQYEVYAYQHNCGTDGTFSTFGHVYIVSGNKPMSWNLAYSEMLDITNGLADTYTYGAGNGTLTAQWSEKTATLTYNANGHGTAPAAVTMKYTAACKLASMSNITATNMSGNTGAAYTFKEWNTKADGSGTKYAAGAEFKAANVIPSNTTLYAIWTESTASLTYNNGGHGTTPSNVTMKYSAETKAASALSATGYTFLNWKGSNNKTYDAGAQVKAANIVPEALTLTAQWSVNAYNISYDLAGGSYGSSHPTTAKWDTAFTVNNPTRTGYDFTGWKITGMDSNTHAYGSETTTATSIDSTKATSFKNLNATNGATVKFTAQWQIHTYSITYNLNKGSGSTDPAHAGTKPTSYNITTDTFTISEPTREGYTFSGWTVNTAPTWATGSTTSGKTIKVAKGTYGNIKLTANWTANTYSISYDYNGGGAGESKPASGTFDTALTISNPIRNGYAFNGWSISGMDSTTHTYGNNTTTNTTLTTNVTSFKNLRATSGTVTFKANWTPNSHKITFKPNGGSFQGTTNDSEMGVTFDSTSGNAPGVATRTGYNFLGWFDSSDKMVFDANGNASVSQTTSYWTANAPDGKWKHDANLTVTAKWQEKTATLTYNANGHGTAPAAVTMKYTTATSAASMNDISGTTMSNESGVAYKFMGWATTQAKANNGTVDYASGAQVNGANVIPQAVTLYAVWKEATATLTYNNGGHGTTPASVTMKYSTATKTATISATGYTFKGWKRSDTGAIIAADAQLKAAEIVPQNITLTAQWTANTYTIEYDLNKGSGSSTPSYGTSHPTTATYDQAFTINNPSRQGFTFNGWDISGMTSDCTHTIGSTSTTATSATEVKDTSFKNLRSTSGTVTFKAKWTVIPYQINATAVTRTIDGSTIATTGGTTSGSAKYNFDDAANLTATVKTGYTFKGWATSKDATSYVSTDTNYKPVVTGEATYYAVFEEQTAYLKYNANGHGTAPNDVLMRYSLQTKTANAMTETGYTFRGWATTKAKADANDPDYTVNQEYKAAQSLKNTNGQTVIPNGATLYGTWVSNKYKITYVLGNNASHGNLHPDEALYDEEFEIDAPTRIGYVFNGWEITGMSSDCTHYYGTTTTSATSISSTTAKKFKNLHSSKDGTVTFTALWTPITYNVQYELSSGNASGTYPATATYDSAFTVNNPTRLGYTFQGWTIEGMDTVTHYYGTSTSTAKKLTGIKATSFKNLTSEADATIKFTAVWKANTYSIHYELEGGSYGSKHPETATYNEAFTVNNPTREGYYFGGWTISGMDTASTHCWDNGNGTTEHGKNETATGVKQKKFKNLRAENGTVTFKATWIEMTAEVTLDNNGYGSALEPIHIRYTQQAKTPENVAITGLHVKEWNTDKDGEGIKYDPDTAFKTANSLTLAGHNDVTIIPDGITLYAIWDEEKGDLRYHANGHGTEPESFLMRYTREAAVGDALSETGWIFKGWNTKADGSGKMYQPGQKFKDAESFDDTEGNTVLPDGADLYAIWEEMNGDLTYDANGHGTAPEKATVWFTKEHKMPATQNVVGYTFKEWNTKSNGKGYGYAIGEVYKKPNSLKSEDGTTVIPSGAKVYAIWTELKGTLKFDANGHGTAPEDMVTRYSQATTTPTMSNVEGYVFLGWATSKDHANAETVDYPAKATFKQANSLKSTDGETVIPGDVTLYAVWVADEGTLTYNAQGHGTAPKAIHIRYSKEAKVASDTMKETGWTFKEWNTKADGTGYSFAPGAAYKEEDTFFNLKGEKVIPSGDTLYAIWIENTATLTYDLNYEGAPDNTTSTMRYTQEEKVKTQVPTRGAGYTFKEWNTGKYGAATGYAPGSTFKKANVDPKDATLYAIWVEETATLTYDANGHGTAPEAETQYYSKQTKVNGSISCAGWIFKGWNTQADGRGTTYQKGSILKNPGQTPHDIVLYAIWEQERHTMTVEANGGKFSGNNDSVSYLMTVNSDEHTSFANLPTLEGKVCTGLYTRKIGGAKIYNENGKITNDGVFFKDGVFVYNSDFTLYAQWSDEPVKCVIYDKNTDDPVSNMPIEETKFLDKPITLSNKIPSREGYTFIYWCTDPTGAKGDTYYVQNGAGSVFPVNDDKAYGNYEDGPVVLYAQWQKNGEGDDAKAKLDVQYNIYTSDVENGILDAEIVYGYRNMFMQNREVKQRRTIFVDSDQELVPEVVISTPSWAESDPIPGFPNKPKPTEPTQPTEPTEPTVEPDPEYTEVKTEEELEAAIKTFDYTKGDKLYLSLGNDIELTKSITIPIEANVDIDFEEKTLSIATSTMKPNGTDCTAALTVLGDLTIGNGTISAADACVSICDMGNFTAKEDIVFTDDATYAVFFEKGAGSATAVLLGTTIGKTDVLCGTQNQFSTLTAKDDAKIASETLYADFTSKNTDGLVIENAYTAADPTNHVNDVEYTVIENTFEDYNYRVTGTDEAVNCKVIAEPQGEGLISGTGDYRQNTTITLEATPAPGSRFVSWVNANGDVVSTKATWTFKLTTDLELTAVFEHIPHDIEVESSDVSMGTVSGEGEYGETEQATIKATPKQGYVFSGWKKIVNGSPEDEFSSTDEEFTFTVTEDALYRAYFDAVRYTLHVDRPAYVDEDAYTIKVKINGNESELNASGDYNLDGNDSVKISASINDLSSEGGRDYTKAYTINSWVDSTSIDEGDVATLSSSSEYSFTAGEDVNAMLVLNLTDDEVNKVISNFEEAQKNYVESEFTTYTEDYLEKAQPIGSIYTSTDESLGRGDDYDDSSSENYHVDLGLLRVQDQLGGKWERIENTFLKSADNGEDVGDTGGRIKYKLSLAMTAGSGKFGYVPGSISSYLQTPSLIEGRTYSKFSKGTGAPSDSVIVTDEEQLGNELDLTPPYQSVYVFKRVDEFEGLSNITDNESEAYNHCYWFSRPGNDVLKSGYIAERLQDPDTVSGEETISEEDQAAYKKGYRYKVVEKPAENEGSGEGE